MFIRKATLEDVRSILEIVNYEIQYSTSNYSHEKNTLDEQKTWFIDRENQGFPVLVCEEDNQITGFGTYGRFREKVGYNQTVEHTIYLHHEHRGKGNGGVLMRELIRIAQEQKIHVMVGGIDADNIDSIRFHEKHGFEKVALFKEAGRKFDRWLDLVFMQLLLDEV